MYQGKIFQTKILFLILVPILQSCGRILPFLADDNEIDRNPSDDGNGLSLHLEKDFSKGHTTTPPPIVPITFPPLQYSTTPYYPPYSTTPYYSAPYTTPYYPPQYNPPPQYPPPQSPHYQSHSYNNPPIQPPRYNHHPIRPQYPPPPPPPQYGGGQYPRAAAEEPQKQKAGELSQITFPLTPKEQPQDAAEQQPHNVTETAKNSTIY